MQKVLFFCSIFFLLFSCSDDGGSENPNPVDTYDRAAMLSNWSENIIKPGYLKAASSANQFKGDVGAFVSAPSISGLQSMRSSWLTSYQDFQAVSMFEIGKAEELRLRNNLNTYPADAGEIHANIMAGDTNLELSSEIDSQGFPAIEYLLYGVGMSDQEIVDFYSTSNMATENKAYLQKLADRVADLLNQVSADWQGSYASTFVSNSGSSANSSVNKLVNDFMFYYEKSLRAGKVGIPAGVFSNDPLPQNVECFYEGTQAKNMLLLALDHAQDFFNGSSTVNPSGSAGLADYLNHLDVVRNGQSLHTIINNQFNSAKTAIQPLNRNFKTQVETDNTAMLSAYDALQQNVVYLKVDMLQALNISVDYVDADGD